MQPTPSESSWPTVHPEDGPCALGDEEVHLWWMDLAKPLWPLGQLAKWLDAEESERAARFHFNIHRRRYIAAHGQMRALLAVYAGLPPQALRFAHEDRGKPLLAGPNGPQDLVSQVGFSLSHSDEHGLLAVARTNDVGVDIEVQRHLPDLESLARSHFTLSEQRELRDLPEERRHDGFFAAWTRKEAYVKALGAGLSVRLDSFEVALHPDEPAALRSVGGSEIDARAWSLWAARPTPSSWAAVAARIPAARVRTFSLRQVAKA